MLSGALTAGSPVLVPLALLVGAGIAYLLVAARAVGRFARTPRPQPRARPGVSVLKPLYGAEPNLRENLKSFIQQNYDDLQIVFGLHGEDDPALAVVRSLAAEFPDRDIAVVVDPRQHGANGKITNLINLYPAARHEILVLADSDMRADPDFVATLVADLERPGVGAVTCLYLGRPEPGLTSALGAQFINHHFLPQVLISRALGSEEGCFGATIALTRATLARIGGFDALKDILADDHEIGRRVRGLGLRVALSRALVDDTVNEPDWESLLGHELRWARTIRQANPAGFAASVVTLPVALATLGVLVSAGDAAAFGLWGLAFGARIWFQGRVDRALGLTPSPFWAPPVRDCLTFAMVVASFLGRRVRWRHSAFRVAPDGSLSIEKDLSR